MSGGVVKVLVCGVVRVEVVLIFGSTCFGAREEIGKIINTVQSSACSVVRRTDSYPSMLISKYKVLFFCKSAAGGILAFSAI
jgi:predicted nucleic-acid-binding protein